MVKVLFSGLLLLPVTALAAPTAATPASALTNGMTTQPHYVQSSNYNPASGHFMVNREAGENFRFGYWSNFSIGTEYGDADSFIDEIEDLIDTLDDVPPDVDTAIDTRDRFNDILPLMGEEGYVKLNVGLSVPGFPMFWSSEKLKGTFSADIAAEVQVFGGLLDDPLRFITNQNNELEYQTNSAGYLKAAEVRRFSFGYSREVWNDDVGMPGGKLIAGAKLNIYNIALTKQIQSLESLEGEDLSEVIEDDYKNNQETTTAAGIDIGAIWHADRFKVGFTISNINEPEFDYGSVGTDCLSIADAIDQANCFTALFHINKGTISSKETHKMQATPNIEGSVDILPFWSVSSSFDLAAYTDYVGVPQRWMSISTNLAWDSYWLPKWRLGFRNNLETSGLKAISLGASWLALDFDFAYGLDKTTVDGDEVPRMFAMAIGFQERF